MALITLLVGFWAGMVVAAWAGGVIHSEWGAVYEYEGWRLLGAPWYLLKGVRQILVSEDPL